MKYPAKVIIKEKARVTWKGIYFKGIYYTCSQAIRKQWFEIARVEGSTTINVYYSPSNSKIIYLVADEGGLERCNVVFTDKYKGSKLEKYFQSIHRLKSKRDNYKWV